MLGAVGAGLVAARVDHPQPARGTNTGDRARTARGRSDLQEFAESRKLDSAERDALIQ